MKRIVALIALALVGACAGILGLRDDPKEAKFPHQKHVYSGINCIECHTTIVKEGNDAPVKLPDDALCATCHAKDCPTGKIWSVGREACVSHDPGRCLNCHGSPTAEAAVVDARDHLRFAHDKHVPVLDGECVLCHQGVRHEGSPLRPTMATCLSCHQHEKDFDPQRCTTCHKNLETEGSLPASHIIHDADWPRRHGLVASSSASLCSACHSQKSCAECHGATTAALPTTLRFDNTMSPTIHRAGWRSRHAEEANAAPGTCNVCHSDSSCRTCHEREGVAATEPNAVNPHPAGWVDIDRGENLHGRAARRDPAACAACHGGDGERLCVTCHASGGVGGNPHPPGWSSNQPKSALPCRLCHPTTM